MSKKAASGLVIIALAALLSSGCRSARPLNQLEFGVWAASHDLWDEAIFRWKKALLQNPDSQAAHNNLAVAYEKKGLWAEARKEYETALKLAPKNPWIKSNFQNFKDNVEPSEKKKKEDAEKEKDEKK